MLSGCGGGGAGGVPERELVLVSGRDDHGLLVQERVTLAAEPEGEPEQASVGDGTLVRVVETRGEWLRVRTVEGRRAEGWVNDYYLRGTVHVCAPGLPRSAQAEILSVGPRGVRVRTVEGARVADVPRASVSELPC